MKPLHIEQPSSTINVHDTLTWNIIHENIFDNIGSKLVEVKCSHKYDQHKK
jgi:hypothetical protein